MSHVGRTSCLALFSLINQIKVIIGLTGALEAAAGDEDDVVGLKFSLLFVSPQHEQNMLPDDQTRAVLTAF